MEQYFTTSFLVGVIDALETPSTFILDTFFPEEATFDTEEVYFDQLEQTRQLAPLVSPMVEGKAQRSRGTTVNAFRPAYLKPKHTVTPASALKRAAGERLGGTLEPIDRYQAAVADNMEIEIDQIARREEYMAIEAMLTGKIIVVGEDYPQQEVDFVRAASQTVGLTGVNRWGENGVSPYKNLAAWAQQTQTVSGVHPGVVVLDPLAGGLLQEDPLFQAAMDNRRQDGGTMQFLAAATGAVGEEMVLLGRVGQFEIWQYQQIYTDATGVTQQMMPDYTVLMGSPRRSGGVRCYGAILDVKVLRAMRTFPKYWETEDPSVGNTMTQSAPLPAIGRPNATFSATVR